MIALTTRDREWTFHATWQVPGPLNVGETKSRSDAEVSEISPGDLDLSCEAIVGYAEVIFQSCLPAHIHSDHRLEACFNPVRTVERAGCLLCHGLGCLLGNGK